MHAAVFDHTPCALGEGALWHPERACFFWFDILNGELLSRREGRSHARLFEDSVSAAGWIDADHLLVASSRALIKLQIDSGAQEEICALEADKPLTRSNDGRADPFGGFWIGTMGHRAEPGAGAIYRYYRGELRCLYPGLTIPNAICFAPDGQRAYFCDSSERKIMQVALDAVQGWPKGDPEVFVDLSIEAVNPDGAVIDQDGRLWNAQWGAGRVACYDTDGRFLQSLELPARHTSCPAFGGHGLDQMLVTTALQGLDAPRPGDGLTYIASFLDGTKGQREHQVVL